MNSTAKKRQLEKAARAQQQQTARAEAAQTRAYEAQEQQRAGTQAAKQRQLAKAAQVAQQGVKRTKANTKFAEAADRMERVGINTANERSMLDRKLERSRAERAAAHAASQKALQQDAARVGAQAQRDFGAARETAGGAYSDALNRLLAQHERNSDIAKNLVTDDWEKRHGGIAPEDAARTKAIRQAGEIANNDAQAIRTMLGGDAQAIAQQENMRRGANQLAILNAMNDMAPGSGTRYFAEAPSHEGTNAADVVPYLLGMTAAGTAGAVGNIMKGAGVTVGDIVTGGKVSNEYRTLSEYLQETPEMERLVMRTNGQGAEGDVVVATISRATGIPEAHVRSYLQATEADRWTQQVENTHRISPALRESAGQWAYSIGQQLPGIALTAGAGAAGQALSKAVTLGLMGAQSYGGKLAENAKKYGFTPGGYANALVTAAIETGTELIDDFVPTAGAILSIAAPTELGKNMLGEGSEEAIGYPLEQLADWLLLPHGEETLRDIFDMKEWIGSFASGAIVGGMMGSTGALLNLAGRVMDGGISLQEAARKANEIASTLPGQYRPTLLNEWYGVSEADVQKFLGETAQAMQRYAEDMRAEAKQHPENMADGAQETAADAQSGVDGAVNETAPGNGNAAQNAAGSAQEASALQIGAHGAEELTKLRASGSEIDTEAFSQYWQAGNKGIPSEALDAQYGSRIGEAERKLAYNAGAADAIAQRGKKGKKNGGEKNGKTQQQSGAQKAAFDLNADRVSLGRLGENGQKGLTSEYKGNVPFNRFYDEYMESYADGVNGAQQPTVRQKGGVLTQAQRMAAFYAGQNDAKASLARETAAAKQAQVAAEPGLVQDDYTRTALTPEMNEKVDRVAKLLGLSVEFADEVTGGRDNASIQGSHVVIEKNNPNPILTILGHETTHRLQELSPETYRAFREIVAQNVGEEVQAKLDVYRSHGEMLNYEQALDEAAADYAGQLMNDTGLLDDFIERNRGNRTLLERLRDAFRALKDKLTGAERKRAETAEGRLSAALDAAAKQARGLKGNEKAAREGGKQTRSMLKMFEDGVRFVDVQTDQEQFDGLSDDDKQKLAKKVIKERFAGKVVGIDNRTFVNGGAASEYSHPTKKLEGAMLDAKMRASTELDNLIDAGHNFRTAPDGQDGHVHPQTVGDFRYFDTIFKVGEDYYKGVINILPVTKGLLLKDITKIENITQDIRSSYGDSPKSAFLRDASMDSIRETSENSNPSAKKFSMKSPAEETRDLLALHNLTEKNLTDAMKLGGLPSPSIAIVKAEQGHANYGPISLVFDKSTIDPEADSRNRVYGSDAWTPTAPSVEYPVDQTRMREIEQEIAELAGQIADGMFRNESALRGIGIEDLSTSDRAALEDRLANSDAVIAAYLAENGQTLEPVRKAKEFSKYGNDTLKNVIDRFGAQELAAMDAELELGGSAADALGENMEALREILRDYYREKGEAVLQRVAKKHGWTEAEIQEKREARIDKTMENVSNFTLEDLVRNAFDFYQDGGKTTSENDFYATRDKLRGAANHEAVRDWIGGKLDGLLGDAGIYNGADRYTSSGERRGFAQTHEAYTLENIVRAMTKQQNARGEGAFGASAGVLMAHATPEYGSISDIRADRGRLRVEDAEGYEALKQQLEDGIGEIISGIKRTNRAHSDNSFEESDIIGSVLLEAADGKKTAADIRRVFRENGYTISDELIWKAQELYRNAAEMPTGYFEAKPQRAVGFDEVLAAVIPDDSSAALKQQLQENGVRTLEYRAGDEADRLRVVNGVESARFSIKEDTTAKRLKKLEQENERLRGRVEELQKQTKRTKRDSTISQKSVQRAASGILSQYGAKDMDAGALSEELQSLYGGIARGGLTMEQAQAQATEIATQLIKNTLARDTESYSEYHDLIDYLRRTELRVPESVRNDIADYNEEIRKPNAGRLKLKNAENTNIDTVYQELSAMHPEFFSEEGEMSAADRLQRIADVMGVLYDVTEVNPNASYMQEAIAATANDVLETFLTLPEMVKVAGDQAQKMNEKHRERVQEILQQQRAKRADALKKLTEKYKAKTKEGREKQKAAQLRSRIQKHASALSARLLRPTDAKNVPEGLRTSVAALLKAIDMDSGTPTARNKALRNMQQQYRAILEEAGDVTIDPDLQSVLEEAEALGGVWIKEMSTEELETVWKAVRAVEYSVVTAGKTLASEKYNTTKSWADALIDGVRTRKPKQARTRSHWSLDLEDPLTFFSHFGEAGKEIYRTLRNAQDMENDLHDRVILEAQNVTDAKEVRELERKVETIQTERGAELKLTRAHLMELYLLSGREQARGHLLNGGVVQPEIRSEKVRRGTEAVTLTEGDLQSVQRLLTEREREIANKLQRITNTTLSEMGNEASMRAYGYRKFTEKNYWRMRAAKEGVHQNVERGGDQPRQIKNIGFAKATTPGAKNALDIQSVFQTFSQHAADMVDYAAWLTPMEDMNRLYNYAYVAEDGKTRTGKTVKGVLNEYAGEGAGRYWMNLMEDIQNGIKGRSDSPMWEAVGRGIGNWKGAKVGANARVIIQQPTAYVRAAAILSPKNMAKGLVKGVTAGSGWKKALQHSAIARRKNTGGFDISNTYQMSERMFGQQSTAAKISELAGRPAAAADAVTWGKIWNACEYQVQEDNPGVKPGSQQFTQLTAELFTDVIDATQVVDGVLQRANIMRSSNEVVKQATSFMGEPLKSLNLVMRTWDNFRYETDPKKRTAARKQMGRAVAALAATNVVNALAQSIIDAVRDDDRDKDYWERLWAAFTGVSGDEENFWQALSGAVLDGNVGQNMNPAGQIPFVKDALSLLQGYDVSRTEMETIGDLIRAGQLAVKSIGGTGGKTTAYALKELLSSTAQVLGVPVGNLTRDMWAVARSIGNATGSIPVQYEMEKAIYNLSNSSNSARYTQLAFAALEQGDMESFKKIRADLISRMGKGGDSVDSSLRTLYKKRAAEDPEFRLSQEAEDAIGASGLIEKTQKQQAEEAEKTDGFEIGEMDSETYEAFSSARAEQFRGAAEVLENDPDYLAMDEQQQDDVMDAALRLAQERALSEASDGEYQVSTKWMAAASEAEAQGISIPEYVLFHVACEGFTTDRDADGKAIAGQERKDKVRAWLKKNTSLTEAQRAWLWGTLYKSEW